MSIHEVAAPMLAHLHAQLPPDGFRLLGVEVVVGMLVDVDADALHAALVAALPGVEVRLVRTEGVLRCEDCGAEYPHDEHPCPTCGSGRATLVGGDELEIRKAWGETIAP
jgi:Zn finger protein HypA/HybF involved in hydrogenase expression